MVKFYSPLRYPGGKNRIFPFVSSLIKRNDLEGCAYVEPFAGGAGLALHLLIEGVVSEIYLNDLDKSIYCFWKTVIENPENVCHWIEDVEVNMKTWRKAKNIYADFGKYSDFEIAMATFYLNRANVSGIITGGPIGGMEQKGKYKINARFNKEDLVNRIKLISTYSKQIHLSGLDGNEFLRRIDSMDKKLFIYIDPPYVNKGAQLYMNFFQEQNHRDLIQTISKLKHKWIVSYDNADLINEIYCQYIRITHRLSQCTSNRIGDEILIIHPDLKFKSSISLLKGPTILKT